MQDDMMNDKLVDVGWQQMRLTLDQEMPQKKKRRFWWLWFFLLFLGISALGAGFRAGWFFGEEQPSQHRSLQNSFPIPLHGEEKPTAQLQPNSKPTVPTATLVPKKVKRDTPQAQKGTVVAQKVNTHPIFIFQVLPTLAPKVATHNLDQPLDGR